MKGEGGRSVAAAQPEFLGWRGGSGRESFALHAVARSGVALELFEPGAASPFRTVALALDDSIAAPFRIWRVDLAGLPGRFEYLVRVDGGPPLLDPYATAITGGEVWGRSDSLRGPGVGRRHRGLVAPSAFDWQAVGRPAVDPARRVIYELHVRGFTRHPSSAVARPGTYSGLVEKIPYLVELGVTTIELMPVCEFDETENARRNPRSGERLLNFWGYSPVSYFAPKAGYAADPAPGAAAAELKTLVRELHRAGIEVVLDVVYNHTAEGGGGAGDPLLSWRGLDDAAYYLRDPATQRPLDLTGTGNTFACQHPVARRMILDSLRHWVEEYRVDGFRFDLAAVFYRGERGERLERSPLVDEIAADPLLRDRLLIAEPWDATGFTPAGGFPAPWLEWDGELRDGVRRFVGGLEREERFLARRLGGLGSQRGRVPAGRSVRFVACHDGRPLADVPAWAKKHNEANGEGNRDGWDGEVAWNGGTEGNTDDPVLADRRRREVRLMAALWAVAPGTLQLTAGDERGRTQKGNTNAWCQDNEIGWIDWSDRSDDSLHFFFKQLLQLREELGDLVTLPSAHDEAPEASNPASATAGQKLHLGGNADGSRVESAARLESSESSGASAPAPGRRSPSSRGPGDGAAARSALIEAFEPSMPFPSTESLRLSSFLLLTSSGSSAWLIAANAGEGERRFPLPKPPAGRAWRLRLDTARPAGSEVLLDAAAPAVSASTSEVAVAPRSARLLVAEA